MACKKLAFIIFISAALAFPQIGNLKFNKLTIKDGLSYNTINDITQDTCGYIWIGTENGLNRYDGYKLKSFFASDDSLDLSNNNIEALTVDRQGRLWIGTLGGGFYRFDALNNGFIKYDKYLYITDFAEDNYGNLWLATDSDGLIKFNPDNQEYIQYKVDYNNYENTISYDDLETLKFINDTTLLIGTPVGLDMFDLKTERFKNLLRSDQLFVTDIAIDKNNDIWVSTAANGIYIYSENLKLKTQKHKNNSGLGDNAIYTLLSDEEKNIWIGTETKGLYLYEYSTGEFRNYDHSLSDIYSLNHNSIDCLFDDGKGTLWVGTYNGGVNYAQKSLKKFRHYYASSPPYGLNNNVVTAFLETLSGEIWIGTDGGGINIFDPARGTFRYLTSDSTSPYILSSNYVLHLYQDSQNNIWVSSYDGGITVINEDRESVRYLTHDLMGDQILPGNFVRHVSEDSQNNIWIVCTSDGLVKYSPQSNQIKIYRFDQDQNTGATTSYNFLQNIMEDSRKNLWIGTLANGLILFDPVTEEYTRFRNNPQDTTSISSNFINDFVEDENNSIWIATKNGLNVYDYKTGKFRITKNAKKLPASNILSLEIDNTGFLWLGTSNGLSRLKFRTEKIKNYYEHNGLQSNQFNLKAAMKDKQGNLYFGGVYGFNIFNPENMPLNKFIPEVIFSDLIIFNKTIDFKKNRDIIARPVNFADEINLSYKDYFFTIEFTANNYIENQNNRYIYKLKGFDNRWNLVNHPGKAVYTNIPPGQYTFTVKASNNDNRWNKNGKSITINIQPPYWETLVFKISIVLLVLLLIYLYVILKTQSIRKRNRILKEINVKYSNEIERRKAAEKSMQIAVDKANEANR
ncbi:MAG: two-component regulator propeller domain-containing protein, partial [Fidelibacterota bacterium]